MTAKSKVVFLGVLTALLQFVLTVLGWGELAGVLCASGADCASGGHGRAHDRGALHQRQRELRREGRPRRPLGASRFQPDCSGERIRAGVHRPGWDMDSRWGHDPVARHFPLCGRWSAAPVAGVRARQPLQRAGCSPARTHAGDARCLHGYIRNPSYLGLLGMMLGWALAFRAGAGVLLTALMLLPLIARIRAEERLLRAHFGADYDNYRAHTWRLIPGIY
jgi:hypothetical protein